jgi:hypothetical protein
MERARQFTYTLQHPHSRVTGEEKVNTWTQTGEEKINTWTQTGEEKVNKIAKTMSRTRDPGLWHHVKLHALVNTTKSPN